MRMPRTPLPLPPAWAVLGAGALVTALEWPSVGAALAVTAAVVAAVPRKSRRDKGGN